MIIKKPQKKNDIVKNLTLNFLFNGQNIKIQCKSNEKIQTIIQKFSAKIAIEANSYIFLCKGKELIINDLTIDENEISDKDTILVADKINKVLDDNKKNEIQIKNFSEIPSCNSMIQLSFILENKIIYIQVSKDTRFSEAVEKFLMKASINIENKEDIACLYNSRRLESNDNRTIEEIFKKSNNIRIDVILTSNVIGA